MSYKPPLSDIGQALRSAGRLDALIETGAYSELGLDITDAILDEAGKLAQEVFRTVAETGDEVGARLENGSVVTPPGYRTAYRALAEGGWMGLAAPDRFGGQGLPRVLSLAVFELLHQGDTSLSMCPLLSSSAIEALVAHGSPAQQAMYLPKMITGEWTGTMNLTEPQAGSDVGALRTKAEPLADGSYAITGQKIYITWGDHDCAENIVHLILARTPGAPDGAKGVSLFVAPKFLVGEDGSLGEPNAVRAIGLEEKMGLHGSPTCTMEYAGAKGWLVGEEMRGMAAMFTMMNAARVHVGAQGVGVAEAAYQHALAYAQERRQGRAPGVEGPAPIIAHPDVQRMLITMRAKIQAGRAICYATMAAADLADSAADSDERARWRRREEFMTPIAKAWSTDMCVEVAESACQVWGGMGFVEESGAPRFYRDAKITQIYEGTNGIQAIDLVGRKFGLEDGLAVEEWLADLQASAELGLAQAATRQAGERLKGALDTVAHAAAWLRKAKQTDMQAALAAAAPFLRMAGDATGAALLIEQAARSREAGDAALARLFTSQVLSRSCGSAIAVTEAGEVGAAAAFLTR